MRISISVSVNSLKKRKSMKQKEVKWRKNFLKISSKTNNLDLMTKVIMMKKDKKGSMRTLMRRTIKWKINLITKKMKSKMKMRK